MSKPQPMYVEFRPKGKVEVGNWPAGGLELFWPKSGLSVLLTDKQAHELVRLLLEAPSPDSEVNEYAASSPLGFVTTGSIENTATALGSKANE